MKPTVKHIGGKRHEKVYDHGRWVRAHGGLRKWEIAVLKRQHRGRS